MSKEVPVLYIPMSENEDNEEMPDQEIWNLVGTAPVIRALHDALRKYGVWPADTAGFEYLCKALSTAEKITYERLSRKEEAPSAIMADPDLIYTEIRPNSPARWYPDGNEETTPDPTRI